MKKMKRSVALLIALIAVVALNTSTISAATNHNPIEIGALSATANTIDIGISYSGTTASCSSMIVGNTSVKSITATYTLKRVNSNGTFTTVKTWSGISSSTRVLTFSGSYSTVSKGQTYRLEVTATLTTTSGSKETVSAFSTRMY